MKSTKTPLLRATTLLLATLSLIACTSTPVAEKEVTLQDLIKEGRYDEAKERFAVKADIDSVDEDGNTALHLAAKMDEAELVTFLITKGAKTKAKNNDGDIPLHVAIKNNALEATKTLVNFDAATIFEKDADGNYALELAIARGTSWYDAVITEQTGGIRDVEGATLAHYFVQTRNETAIDICIRKQLPIDESDNIGKTPLALAFESPEDARSMRIAAMLLLAGAAPIGEDFGYFEDAVRTHNALLRFADGQTPLHLATISGDAEHPHTGIVDYLLTSSTSARPQDLLQAQDISGNTPLHEAVRYGRIAIVKLLLSNGAQVDATDSLGKTPLLLIIPQEAQFDIYNTLLQYRADIKHKDMYGDTVLHIATMAHASKEVIKLLVDAGAPISERNKQGVTPLALAIDQEMDDHVVYFAQHGADIHAEDMDGYTPLTRALSSESIVMLQTLISTENIHTKDSAGNTPLHIALMRDAPYDYVKYLVDTGADVNARNKNGDSVLYLAVEKNKKQEGELLLDKDADIFATNTENYSPLRLAFEYGGDVQDWLITSQTLNKPDGSGNTPLHYAAEWQLDDAIIGLLQKGADRNSENNHGETPLFSAVKGNSTDCISILADNGADINARDKSGNTLLHAAVRWDSPTSSRKAVARTLIALGVEVDAQNLSGKTALSEACQSGKGDMALLLLENGADINATDVSGRTILADSVQSNKKEMVRMLLSKGANPNIQDSLGRNAYHEAARLKNLEIITLIRGANSNPLARDRDGNTPFSIALSTNDETLIKTVVGSDTTIVDTDGNTPIHIAVERKVPARTLTMLLNMGYPASQRNGDGVTALYKAAVTKQVTLAELLLERGADPYIATTDNDCALSVALKTKNFELLDAIVKYTGNKGDLQGDGILHYAARFGDNATVTHLLALGLDKKTRNIANETPADMAKRWQKPDVAILLQ